MDDLRRFNVDERIAIAEALADFGWHQRRHDLLEYAARLYRGAGYTGTADATQAACDVVRGGGGPVLEPSPAVAEREACAAIALSHARHLDLAAASAKRHGLAYVETANEGAAATARAIAEAIKSRGGEGVEA